MVATLNEIPHQLAARVGFLLGAFSRSGGGLLLADVSVRLLTHAVGPPGVLFRGTFSSSEQHQLKSPLRPPVTIRVRYLSPDDDAVFLEAGVMRRLVGLPLGEGHVGLIGPFKQQLVLQIIQANPEHVCRHWRV